MHLTKSLNIALLLAITCFVLPACSEGGGASAESVENAKKINMATTSAGNAFHSMWRAEQGYASSDRKPQRSDLDVFWMALQSTARDLERVDKMLAEDPALVDQTRNYWNGRVQENLSKIEASGMLSTMDGPITSMLGKTYGEERVRKDIDRLLAATSSIQDRLGIERTPFTGTTSEPPAES